MRHGARRRITRKRATLLVAWLLGVIGIIGTGGFASFTRSASGSTPVNGGTLTIGLGATGAATNRLNISATNLAPGDTIERTVDLINTGNVDHAQISLTTTAPVTSSLLNTDTTNGLQMFIDRCSGSTQPGGGWLEAGPPYTYTCPSGTITNVLASPGTPIPWIQTNAVVTPLTSLTVGNTDHLHIKLSFPSAADGTFQGLSSTVIYTFNGTQRAATAK